VLGILVVYSASGQNVKMVEHHLGTSPSPWRPCWPGALATPQYLRLFAPFAYAIGVLLLVVDVTGHVGKGAHAGSTSASCASNPPRS